jgi:hypothetical protein
MRLCNDNMAGTKNVLRLLTILLTWPLSSTLPHELSGECHGILPLEETIGVQHEVNSEILSCMFG